jgi:AbrB family looped-hinge helix DNA binding protein
MTMTVKVSADGTMVLPKAFRKSRRIRAGTALRVTEAGESLLLTPVHPPSEAEMQAVIEASGGAGDLETGKSRKQVEGAIERVRARARKRKAQGRS